MTKAKTKTGNPFLDGEFGNVLDLGNFVEQLRVPGIDSTALIESQRRNFEALSQANRLAFEGMQAIVHRQSEILRQALDEASKVVRELAKPGKPEEKWAQQADLVKEAYELAVANLRELTEMGAKSNGEAAEVLNHRFAASITELKGAFKPVNATK